MPAVTAGAGLFSCSGPLLGARPISGTHWTSKRCATRQPAPVVSPGQNFAASTQLPEEDRMADGLDAIFLNNRAALLRFLRARADHDSAEDLLQELWLRAARGASEPVADPLAYLYRAANNLVIDRHRSSVRRVLREREWVKVVGGQAIPLSSSVSGEEVILARDEIRAVQAALAALGERTETIFRRFRLDGVSHRQIAGELGISVSAVEKHLQKAYRALVELRRRQLDAG